MPYSIMLDAGHGGRDPGAVYKVRKEKDDTLRLTLAVGEILEAHGLDVQYTRRMRAVENVCRAGKVPSGCWRFWSGSWQATENWKIWIFWRNWQI